MFDKLVYFFLSSSNFPDKGDRSNFKVTGWKCTFSSWNHFTRWCGLWMMHVILR